LLDDQFQQLQMLQDPSAPDFVAEVVTLFCEDGERIIGELAKLLYVCFLSPPRPLAMFCLIRCLILRLGIRSLCACAGISQLWTSTRWMLLCISSRAAVQGEALFFYVLFICVPAVAEERWLLLVAQIGC
jgi:hypothetical protein